MNGHQAATAALPRCAQHTVHASLCEPDATPGLNYCMEHSQAAVYKEAQRQAQRHLAAECRRQWKMLPAHARRLWELKAAQENEHNERKEAAMASTVSLAQSLERQLEDAAAENDSGERGSRYHRIVQEH